MKVGVVGVGYLGKIHLKCLKETSFLMHGIFDIDEEKAKMVSESFNVKRFQSLEALIDDCDVINIVSDTSSHFEIAKQALIQDKHAFVEKPLTNSADEANQLSAILKERPHLKLQVGHIERYNPAFVTLKDFQLNPQFVEIHRLSPYDMRGTDVSVVMDLMIHDLDLLLHVIPSKIREIQANGVQLFSNSPDICNARLTFENGCVVNITASRISLKSMRKMRIFQADAYVNIDFLEKQSQIIRLSEHPEEEENTMAIETSLGTKYMSIKTNHKKDHNSIVMELQDFYNSIVYNTDVSIGIDDAVRVIELANQIEEEVNKI